MLTLNSSFDEVQAAKAAFKSELKALLLKYNAEFCADVEGDTHGLTYRADVFLNVRGSYKCHAVISNPHGLCIDASDCD